jgi:hypothetical protein
MAEMLAISMSLMLISPTEDASNGKYETLDTKKSIVWHVYHHNDIRRALIADGKHDDLPESFELSVPHTPVVSIDTDGAGKPSAAAANKFRL